MSDQQAHKIYEFADFRLLPGEGLLLRNNQPVPLSPKVFETLLFLIERRGHLVLKSELLDNVWTDAFVEENAVSKSVWSIRNALQEDSKNPQFIQTVPKRGYRFVGEVREVSANAAELATSDVVPRASVSPYRTSRRFRWILAIAAIGVIAVIALWSAGFGGLQKPAERLSKRSLAVMPFDNASDDPAIEYLVDGVNKTLIADLTRVEQLEVKSLTAELLKSENRDPNYIGEQLMVDSVLSGSVSLSGDQIRIYLQLVEAKTGRTLWAKPYEGDKNNIQGLQKQVAREFARDIRVTLSATDRERLSISRRAVPEAYDHYLRARYYANLQNEQDQLTAIAEFEQAVQIDPEFATAHAELALAYIWKDFSFFPGHPELAEKASMAMERSLQLDPNLPMGYLARGRLLWTPVANFQHEKAARDYRTALDLDLKLDEAWNQLAMVYTHIGALDEALRAARTAVEINPNNHLLSLRLGQTLNSQTNYAEALAVLQSIQRSVHPQMIGHQTAWALLNLGRTDEASAEIDQLLKDHPEDKGGTFASVKAVLAVRAGDHHAAENWIRQALEKGKDKGYGHFHHTAYTIGCAYALMNKPDEALKYLEMAASTGFPCYPSYEKDPNLNSLRQDPRFIAFMEKLEQQWKDNMSRVVAPI